MDYFTSDPHFGHEKIIQYQNRPWKTADEMNAALITNINARVTEKDTLWILGDIFFTPVDTAHRILDQIVCKNLRVVMGNHDRRLATNNQLLDRFERVYYERADVNINGVVVIMDHYPLLSWRKAGRGSYMLHGHCHGNVPFDPKFRRLDVGVDCHNYSPISWLEIRKKLDAIDPADARGR